jgi:16S rRNA (uracil1498-N3)-methyltransferase
MHRFFEDRIMITDSRIILKDKQKLHHIRDVLRLKAQEEMVIFDSMGNEFLVALEGMNKENAIFIIKKRSFFHNAGVSRFTVGCALPKKAKMDDIVDKLTQLGVDRIVPLNTKRVVVKIDREKEAGRINRWRKISQSAAEQSHRSGVPIVDEITEVVDFFTNYKGPSLKLIPTLEAKGLSLDKVFSNKNFDEIVVAIGPEGDFTKEEVRSAENSGFIPVSLGKRVLRVDTAAIFIASIIINHLERGCL